MAMALSLALAAHLLVHDTPPDPAGDAPPPPMEGVPLDPAPIPDPTEPEADATPAAPPARKPSRFAPSGDALPDNDPKVQSAEAPLADGFGIGVGTAVGGIILGALPGAACGWVPFVGIPIACFGTAVGAGAGGVIGTVLSDGDLDGNVLLLGAAGGLAGAGALVGASAGTLLVLTVSQGSSSALLLSLVGASALSFVGAGLGSIGAGLLVAAFPPPRRAVIPEKRTPERRRGVQPPGDDALDAVHHAAPSAPMPY